MKWKKQFAGNSSLVLSLQMYKNTLGVKKDSRAVHCQCDLELHLNQNLAGCPSRQETMYMKVETGELAENPRLKLGLTGTQPTYNDCRGGSRD